MYQNILTGNDCIWWIPETEDPIFFNLQNSSSYSGVKFIIFFSEKVWDTKIVYNKLDHFRCNLKSLFLIHYFLYVIKFIKYCNHNIFKIYFLLCILDSNKIFLIAHNRSNNNKQCTSSKVIISAFYVKFLLNDNNKLTGIICKIKSFKYFNFLATVSPTNQHIPRTSKI